jgi:hypothetical protein
MFPFSGCASKSTPIAYEDGTLMPLGVCASDQPKPIYEIGNKHAQACANTRQDYFK